MFCKMALPRHFASQNSDPSPYLGLMGYLSRVSSQLPRQIVGCIFFPGPLIQSPLIHGSVIPVHFH